jgi:serine/threonine protein kinase
MYAMLVGKLPFRSPRQGTKRRQKLLEQITNGISESHEKEMAHLSPGARDLIGRLLQPDPRKRTMLIETMSHPWVTKDGAHPLSPYKQPIVDAATQATVSVLSCIATRVVWRSWCNIALLSSFYPINECMIELPWINASCPRWCTIFIIGVIFMGPHKHTY